jgi:hypothetical protein
MRQEASVKNLTVDADKDEWKDSQWAVWKGKGVVQEVRLEGAVRLDVRGSVHHATILTLKNPTRCNSVIKILLFLILNEAQHVSGDTPSNIRSLKLHKQPLVLYTLKLVGCAVVGRCQIPLRWTNNDHSY